MRDHVRHKLKVFAELEAAVVRLFVEFLLCFPNYAFDVVHLHLEVVIVEAAHHRSDVLEDGLSVAIVDDLLLGYQKLGVNEVLFGALLEVLLGK